VVADGSGATSALPGGGFILLDTAVTPELAAEGLARDVIRAVQQARRSAALEVSDRIRLTIAASPAASAAMRAYSELITAETLATGLELTEVDALDSDPDATGPVQAGDGEQVRIRITR
jgi:isoleucyl-tRNA synthetase